MFAFAHFACWQTLFKDLIREGLRAASLRSLRSLSCSGLLEYLYMVQKKKVVKGKMQTSRKKNYVNFGDNRIM